MKLIPELQYERLYANKDFGRTFWSRFKGPAWSRTGKTRVVLVERKEKPQPKKALSYTLNGITYFMLDSKFTSRYVDALELLGIPYEFVKEGSWGF